MEGQCISCEIALLQMGIDVRSYAQKAKTCTFFLCRLRYMCSSMSRGVLENDTPAGRINSNVLLGNDVNLMDLLNNK
jgi:hypothetical protein